MLVFGDVAKIANLDMKPYALRVVQHDYQPANTVKMYGAVQTNYPRKNWSSMMLMDCAKLKVWSKSVVETQTVHTCIASKIFLMLRLANCPRPGTLWIGWMKTPI